MASEERNNPKRRQLQLEFVTAEHPDRFRETSVRKLIRGHIRRGALERSISNASSSKVKETKEEARPTTPDAGLSTSEKVKSVNETPDTRKLIIQDAALHEAVRRQGSQTNLTPLLNEFPQLPKYNHKYLRPDILLKDFFVCFGRPIAFKYLEILLQSDTALLSYCCLAALWKSQISRKPARTTEFLTARQEVIQRINRALSTPSLNSSNDTIMSIHHQIFIDFYISSKEVIQAHVSGLDRVVQLRGGLEFIDETGEIAHVIRIGILIASIIADTRAPSMYRHTETRGGAYIDPTSPLPERWRESPLNWEGQHMSSLVECTYCTPKLHSLMCELRELTQTFLTYGMVPPPLQNLNYQNLLQYHSQPYASMEMTFRSSHERRSAWIYEACRLAGLIYAAALCYHLPFASAWSKASMDFRIPQILQKLGYAIVNTDFHSEIPMWGNLISCFFWFSFISSATACIDADAMSGNRRDEVLLRRSLLVQPVTYIYGVFHSELAGNAFQCVNTMLDIQAMLAVGTSHTADVEETKDPLASIEEDNDLTLDFLYDLAGWNTNSTDAAEQGETPEPSDFM